MLHKKVSPLWIVAIIGMLILILATLEERSHPPPSPLPIPVKKKLPEAPQVAATASRQASDTSKPIDLGETAHLYCPVEGLTLPPVAVDRKAFRQMVHTISHRDLEGLGEMLHGGTIFPATNGAKVRILDFSFTAVKVRLLEGANKGRAGWVVKEWVR